MNQPVIMGLWPIAGITTIGVTRQDALATIQTAIDHGITTFDSAYSYGFDGESDRLIGPFLQSDRDRLKIIGKVGQRWTADHKRIIDGSPQTLVDDAETSLRRMGIQQFDLLMLHSPDPNVDIRQSANTMGNLLDRGLTRQVGICNADEPQRATFQQATRCHAIQCPLNLLQPETLTTHVGPAAAAGCDVHVYWTLMKGLLAGKIGRDHVFADGDSRPGYAVFQGEQRARAHRVVDQLKVLANDHNTSVAALSIGWAASQAGVAAALAGARRPDQALELAAATRLETSTLKTINQIVDSA